jgi:Holliday junction resolvase-like predicted endonuclease
MSTIDQGRLGEAAVAKFFVEHGYDVYMPTFGNAKFDMIVHKDGIVQTVEVKSSNRLTSSGKYQFQLRKVRSNKTANIITNFDSKGIDILALYVIPTGKVMPLVASDFEGSGTVTLSGEVN